MRHESPKLRVPEVGKVDLVANGCCLLKDKKTLSQVQMTAS